VEAVLVTSDVATKVALVVGGAVEGSSVEGSSVVVDVVVDVVDATDAVVVVVVVCVAPAVVAPVAVCESPFAEEGVLAKMKVMTNSSGRYLPDSVCRTLGDELQHPPV
jgi:cytochrome c-type biogenesis protein CcmE